jgi:hypothetical protein
VLISKSHWVCRIDHLHFGKAQLHGAEQITAVQVQKHWSTGHGGTPEDKLGDLAWPFSASAHSHWLANIERYGGIVLLAARQLGQGSQQKRGILDIQTETRRYGVRRSMCPTRARDQPKRGRRSN